ncbi:methyltransferase domain-containing protein [Roseospirillum parvum]|uniref:Methyltransferase domain-containing protein n=1 Tax=Roseospirillum parvum TaxID=83401 RepID=A0A1G7VY72_9PROT|nr:methyltransferase domain-containing protein [Roseospirillum parvum]SDG64724.1 Methyltransferase domain-containing protein [Roseospirillum parvum]
MSPPRLFDRALLRHRRDRAAPRLEIAGDLLEAAAERLIDRLDDTTRRFPRVLDLGCHDGRLGRRLIGRPGVERLVQCDLSAAMAARAAAAVPGALTVIADEEALPFAPESFDLVISSLSLGLVNDLPGTLAQVRRLLAPDGLFLAGVLGGATLGELRAALGEAEIAEEGGLSPRVHPMLDVRDAGDLLARAGLALPVADREPVTLSYSSPLALMAEARALGQSNLMHERRRRPLRRGTLGAALAAYQAAHEDDTGRVTATVEWLTLTAWAPHPDQPRPAPRGSGQMPLAEALEGAVCPTTPPE